MHDIAATAIAGDATSITSEANKVQLPAHGSAPY
jgi:hypothetical protein